MDAFKIKNLHHRNASSINQDEIILFLSILCYKDMGVMTDRADISVLLLETSRCRITRQQMFRSDIKVLSYDFFMLIDRIIFLFATFRFIQTSTTRNKLQQQKTGKRFFVSSVAFCCHMVTSFLLLMYWFEIALLFQSIVFHLVPNLQVI